MKFLVAWCLIIIQERGNTDMKLTLEEAQNKALEYLHRGYH
jgi:hypothetical protein